MNCVECKTSNPDESRYCSECGSVLGRSLEETALKKFRDRKAIEVDITESVAARLMKWAGWLTKAALVIVTLFGLLLGKSYYDIREQVKAGGTEISTAVTEAKQEIETVRHANAALKDDLKQVQSDTEGYKQTNVKIANLQKQIFDVRSEVIDLSAKTLKVKKLDFEEKGPFMWSIGMIGCASAVPTGYKISYCTQGSPPVLTQLASSGDMVPVASKSPVGFQDISTGAKPNCSATNRGTLYVEKGTADKPFLCAKKSDGAFAWMELLIR